MTTEEKLWAIVEVIAYADSEELVGSLDVDIPKDGYPRQWLVRAARQLVDERGEPA
jgi:hypothetical protein